jgi:hypothetical protein
MGSKDKGTGLEAVFHWSGGEMNGVLKGGGKRKGDDGEMVAATLDIKSIQRGRKVVLSS